MNKKVVLVALCLFFLCVLFIFLKDTVRCCIRYFLEAEKVKFIFTALMFTMISYYSIFNKHETDNTNICFYRFKNNFWLLDLLLNSCTYISIFLTAFSLLKGTYIQKFYGDKIYFLEFEAYDIYVMFGVSLILLWYALYNCVQMFIEVVHIKSSKKPII